MNTFSIIAHSPFRRPLFRSRDRVKHNGLFYSIRTFSIPRRIRRPLGGGRGEPLPFGIPVVFLFYMSMLAGCATTSLNSDFAPGVQPASWKTAYVRKLPEDERGIEKIISDQLNSMGLESTYGPSTAPQQSVDVVVTYQDRWMWDLTMYMLDLQIQMREPKTDVVVASGHSYRTSLARKSPEEMVQEVLNEIFHKSGKQE